FARAEALDRRHLGAVDEGRQIQAAGHGLAVDQHGAAAAQALAAALAHAVEAELALQQVDQRVVWRDVGADLGAVEGETDGSPGTHRGAHHSSSSGLPSLARSARKTASGLSGSSVRRTPTASSMALAIAGDTQKVATSPTPLPPNGPLCWKVSTTSFTITAGRSVRPGIL